MELVIYEIDFRLLNPGYFLKSLVRLRYVIQASIHQVSKYARTRYR